MRKLGIILSHLLVISLLSCNSEEGFDCFKTVGKTITQEVPTESFNVVQIEDGLDVYFKNAIEENVIVEGGENLLPKIMINSRNDTLHISNENTCNWTRDYQRIKVFVSLPELRGLIHNGFGNVYTLDTLKTSLFQILVQESTGDLHLVVDNKWTHVVSNSLSLISISGKTDRLWVGYYFNDGQFDSKNLEASLVEFDHKGYSKIKLRFRDTLEGSITFNGTLEYYTEDGDVDVEILANGKLIHAGS